MSSLGLLGGYYIYRDTIYFNCPQGMGESGKNEDWNRRKCGGEKGVRSAKCININQRLRTLNITQNN